MNDDDLLYHYTSASGLIGILGNTHSAPALWLTQIQYMNDDAEFYHAYELAQKEIVRLSGECPGVRKVISGMYGLPYEKDGGTPYPIGRDWGTRIFVFSLTEKPDLLSQWRGYAPEGGYCIGFKVADLKRLAAAHALDLFQCMYRDEEKSSNISSMLREIEANLRSGYVDPEIPELSRLEEAERAEATARLHVQMILGEIAPMFKHSSFEEEREWRIVGVVGANDTRARWRARGNAIIPYCELDISASGPSPLPAAEVIVGPGVDFALANQAIRFMNYNSFGQVPIKLSASTLRR